MTTWQNGHSSYRDQTEQLQAYEQVQKGFIQHLALVSGRDSVRRPNRHALLLL